ncbi:MAG: hypothetical protein AAB916_01205 [Patescibacteria group bacterium]
MENEKMRFGHVVSRSCTIKITTPGAEGIDELLFVETQAWGTTSGENLEASREKIIRRIRSFPEGITLATIWGPEGIYEESDPVGSQYAFRCEWNGDPTALSSWDEHTADGWTDTVHCPDGNTGFLVGVGVVPGYRQYLFYHNHLAPMHPWGGTQWEKPMRISELLIAVTLDNLFKLGVERIIGNARIPGYHFRPTLTVEEYCKLRREDGKLSDPVLRFHERMGAEILKPVLYSMEDPESRNAGCWVIYRHPFAG